MTNHYAAPGLPPCRCPWCLANPPAPDWHATHMQKLRAGYRAWRERQRAERHQARQTEQERQRTEADDLADWLAQDVH